MKITTTGSLGNVAKPLVKKLIAAGHQVTVITTQTGHAAEIEALGATAAIGSVTDAEFLNTAFNGADAVYAMLPPSIGNSNFIENIAEAGRAYARAIETAAVPRVVLLSSVGADAPTGTGPVQGVHRVEETFKRLHGTHITVLRSGFFFVNFFRDIAMLKSKNILGNNYGGEIELAFTHPADLSTAIAAELEQKGNGFDVKYVVSDISTGNQVAQVLGKAIGKPELTWTEVPDEQLRQGMGAAGMPAELIELIIELGQGVRAGIVTRHFFATGAKVTGSVKLAQFADEFRNRYQQA